MEREKGARENANTFITFSDDADSFTGRYLSFIDSPTIFVEQQPMSCVVRRYLFAEAGVLQLILQEGFDAKKRDSILQ